MFIYNSDKATLPPKRGRKKAEKAEKSTGTGQIGDQLLQTLSSITSKVSSQEKTILALTEMPKLMLEMKESLSTVVERVDRLDKERLGENEESASYSDPMDGILNDFGLNDSGQFIIKLK